MKNRSDRRILVVILFAVILIGGIDQKTKNALKVQHILKKIETHPARSEGRHLTAEVTQVELNAYIDYLLAQEKDPQINSLKVVLLKNNQIRGKLRSNANYLNLGFLFGDELDFTFKGILHTRSGKARLNLSALQLNGRPLKPEMLDLILGAAAQYNGTEPCSIGDWYELPKGVKRILVNSGKAVLYY